MDSQALAQHYGLTTDLLDFTSNFDVASFFAVCYRDEETGQYKPVIHSEEPGIIYRITPALFCEANPDVEVDVIGWQPLKRPEQQRAFGLRLKREGSLSNLRSVQMIKFRHCETISNRIWEFFDKGRSLFPRDAADQLARQMDDNYKFTRQQIDRAWGRLDIWNGNQTTREYRLAIEADAGIHLGETSFSNWQDLLTERDERIFESQLRDVLNEVRYRRVLYPE